MSKHKSEQTIKGPSSTISSGIIATDSTSSSPDDTALATSAEADQGKWMRHSPSLLGNLVDGVKHIPQTFALAHAGLSSLNSPEKHENAVREAIEKYGASENEIDAAIAKAAAISGLTVVTIGELIGIIATLPK